MPLASVIHTQHTCKAHPSGVNGHDFFECKQSHTAREQIDKHQTEQFFYAHFKMADIHRDRLVTNKLRLAQIALSS